MIASQDVRTVQVGPVRLPGELVCIPGALGVAVFVHGSGSSHRSPRNRYVGQVLNDYRLNTLLFDLLSQEEASVRSNVFDIGLLVGRLVQALSWLQAQADVGTLPVGLFGASTGAAAALQVAAEHPHRVAAVVCRGGRPDLAGVPLADVLAPTLLIVGGRDPEVLRINQDALRGLHCPKRLEVVTGATHLFEEPGALDTVAHLAGHWLVSHLRAAATN
jgi:putative phosphoribosyl transferase